MVGRAANQLLVKPSPNFPPRTFLCGKLNKPRRSRFIIIWDILTDCEDHVLRGLKIDYLSEKIGQGLVRDEEN